MVASGEGWRAGIVREFGINITHAVFQTDNQQEPTAEHTELYSMLCSSLDGRGDWGRMDTRICDWLSPFTVHLKLSQHC